MARLFKEHITRKVRSLNGKWTFRVDKDNVGKDEKWYLEKLQGESVTVPSVWNQKGELFTYEGVAWYEKEFYFEGGTAKLCFDAVMTEADVYLDGEYIGNHYGGFCQFDFIKSGLDSGWHRLTLRVDNGFDSHSIPQKTVDWYHYGGIVRDVRVESLRGISVLYNHFDYELSADLLHANAKFTVAIRNVEDKPVSTGLSLCFDGKIVSTLRVSLDAGEEKTVESDSFEICDVRLWDIKHGEMYDIAAYTETDDLYDRVGFRKIEVVDGKIHLNGNDIKLMGVNRHEEYPKYGFAFPQKRMMGDIELIENMHCNMIRGSHYTNSREFMDLVDTRGLLFWSEIPIWGGGFSEEALADEIVLQRGLDMHREMVKYYYNHPSIIMWGMHNEILVFTEAAREMSKLYYNYLKENGGQRLVVYATTHPMRDICMDYTDVICLNLYYGWYGGSMENWKDALDKFVERQHELGFAHKPILMSEFGAAALYGCHDDENIKWTEEYQAKLLAHCVELFLNYEGIVGSLIWQFCDIRTCTEMGISRARGFNNKGIVNEYRKPKLAYHRIKEIYGKYND